MILGKIYNKIKSKIQLRKFSYASKLDISKYSKILILAPHPDDESIGCGGIMLIHDNVDVICITDGSLGIPSMPKSEVVEIRKNEFKRATDYANINSVYFLNIPDGKINENWKIFKSINFKKYDLILTPNINDQHIDHYYTSKFVAKSIKNKLFVSNSKIAMYEVWNPISIPNKFIDISKIVEKKKELIKFHKSQCKIIDYSTRIIALNHYRGMSNNVKYSEVYKLFNQKDYLKLFY